jgi:hypothetical protein
MTYAMEQKLQILEEYIEKLEVAANNNDSKEAQKLQTEIIGVYDSEIDGLRTNLDNYSGAHLYLEEPVDFIGDARLLKAKLVNYKCNLESGLYKLFQNSDGGVTVSQHVNQDVNATVVVTLDQTINNIQKIPEAILSEEEKETLLGKITAISAEKDSKKRWEKVSSALKWIADKGIQVGIAALPYIAKALEAN